MPLTDEQKSTVLRLRNEGMGYLSVAKRMDVTRDQVRDYCRTNAAKEKANELNLNIGAKSRKVQQRKPRYCKQCGVEQERRGSLYCSNKCKKEMSDKRIEKRKIEKTIKCATCNSGFIPYKPNQKYCSKECGMITKNCLHCGEEFTRPRKKQYESQNYCSQKCNGKGKAMSHEEYYKKFYKKHGGLLVPLSMYVKGEEELETLCLVCNNKTIRKACQYIYNDRKRGCSHCQRTPSIGEHKVREWLNSHGIAYEEEYTFDDLADQQKLRFDFAILSNGDDVSMLIEYDGRQHFKPSKQFGGKEYFEDLQRKDKMKNDYVKKNGIRLLRIKYTDKNKLNDILVEHVSI